MNLTSKLILHLDDDRLLAPVPAVQGDTARSVEVALYAGGQPWVIPAEATTSIRYRRSDGAGDAYDMLSDGSKAWSVHDNTVTVNLVPEVLAVSGTTTMQIAMQRGEAILSTFSFQIQVQADPSAGASAPGIPSQSGGGTVELQPLTFTGAVEATYDGKKPVTVPIPDGGNVDLSNYYTKAETDNAIADAVAGIEVPDGAGSCVSYEIEYKVETEEAVSILELPFDDLDMIDKVMNADRVEIKAHIAVPTTEDTDATTRGNATLKIACENLPSLVRYVMDANISPTPTDTKGADILVSAIMLGGRIAQVSTNCERRALAYIQTMNSVSQNVTKVEPTKIKTFSTAYANNRFQLSSTVPMGAGSYIKVRAYRGDC